MARYRGFRAFGGQPLSEYLDRKKQRIPAYINDRGDSYIVSVNEDDFCRHLRDYFRIDPDFLDFDQIVVSPEEEVLTAEEMPTTRITLPGMTYLESSFVFCIPITGDDELVRRRPRNSQNWTVEVFTRGGSLCFSVIPFSEDSEKLQSLKTRNLDNLRWHYNAAVAQIEAANEEISNEARSYFLARKATLLKRQELAEQIGVPLAQRANVPSVYSVPPIKDRVPLPIADIRKTSRIDPTLDDAIYIQVLEVINASGKMFERLPTVYEGKDEESLRDHILFNLAARWEYPATGETFNKAGRTDILLRYQDKNVFVAECKFWRGQKEYTEAVDQLLQNLVWRDSKAALIVFVDNVDMNLVRNEARKATEAHECFVREMGARDDSWTDFEFHLPDAETTKIKVALMMFHLAPVTVKRRRRQVTIEIDEKTQGAPLRESDN